MSQMSASPEAPVRVSSIFIYPIKSCRGISVSQAALTSTGFRWDRQWLVVNYKGRAYTQRVEPKLALIEVAFPNEAFSQGWEPSASSYLEIKAPGMDVLKVSLRKPNETADGVSVWEWSGSALDEGNEASKWFCDYLGKPSRLVRFNTDSETRNVDPKYAAGHQIMFSDGYPFLLISQGSLDALNQLLKEPVPINRFRPNILVEGSEAYAEDLWTEIRINKFIFQGVKLCSRCKAQRLKQRNSTLIGIWLLSGGGSFCHVPSINQETGIPGTEPGETLVKIRSDGVLRQTQKKGGRVYFGQNMVWKDRLTEGSGHMLKVGDPVSIISMVSSAAEAAA